MYDLTLEVRGDGGIISIGSNLYTLEDLLENQRLRDLREQEVVPAEDGEKNTTKRPRQEGIQEGMGVAIDESAKRRRGVFLRAASRERDLPGHEMFD